MKGHSKTSERRADKHNMVVLVAKIASTHHHLIVLLKLSLWSIFEIMKSTSEMTNMNMLRMMCKGWRQPHIKLQEDYCEEGFFVPAHKVANHELPTQ